MLTRFEARPLLFAGSSLALLGEEECARLEVWPPAQRGDLLRAVEDSLRPRRILLADGVFGSELAVTPRECRAVIDKGHLLFGCSSLGALRAADCYTIGMIGIGEVFLGYVSGYHHSDADVAVLYDQATRIEVGWSLVHVRSVLRELSLDGSIDRETLARATARVRALPWERRWREAVVATLANVLTPNQLARFATRANEPESNPKKRDCRLAVELITRATR